MGIKILRKKAVQEITSIGATTIDQLEGAGQFPHRRNITERIVGWPSNEIDDYVKTVMSGRVWDQAGMESRLGAAV